MKHFFDVLIHSFPIQLVFTHTKRNLALILVWVTIVAAFSGGLGKVYGIHYLFLDPEYLGKVSFWSFFFVGLSYGILIIAFHITSYILNSHLFRFVGVLTKPFSKFSLNNSLIPLLTLAAYIIQIIRFQGNNEDASFWSLTSYLMGLFAGIIATHFIMFFYFQLSNRDILKYLTKKVDDRLRKSLLSRDRMMHKLKENKQNKFHVHSYLGLDLRLKTTSDIVNFPGREAILKVFDQNHFNLVVVELAVIIVILVLGFFLENAFLQIPAAASALLIFSIAVMLVGAISFWFKSWSVPLAALLFIVVNIAVKNGIGKGVNQAAGINYDKEPTPYTIEKAVELQTKDQYVHDRLHMLEVLENWKSKWKQPKKEKMVFLCVSGGGQRAALWTVNSLLHADSIVGGKLFDQTFLITGASGGIIGASYYREMFLRNDNIALSGQRNQLLNNIGKDNLNPVIFSLLVNDLFFKFQHFNYAGKRYPVDRGYTFEMNLNRNLQGVLDKKLTDYKVHEEQANVPILIMSPTIANDGRKLYLSTQPVSYLGVSSEVLYRDSLKIRGIDFNALFDQHSAADLHFISALRMSASFPYITPTISLPSSPRIEIMDAGISDNFGVSDALRFLHVFQEWIADNTDGVVLLIVRDSKSNVPISDRPIPSLTDRITYPIASVYKNLSKMQDVANDLRIEQAKNWFEGDFEVVEIAYDSYSSGSESKEAERASLSWHLTSEEKKNIIRNIHTDSNTRELNRLKNVIKP